MPTSLATFTHLELIIACGVAEGLTDAQIGAQIGCTRNQIKNALQTFRSRHRLVNRTALALFLYSIV